MKIKYMDVGFDSFCRQKISFCTNLNVIHSSNNSKGKTTLIRIILFILGFKVNPTKGVVFDSMEYKMIVENANGNEICISRQWLDDYNYVHIRNGKNDTKVLYGEHYDAVKTAVFSGMSEDLITNILGAFYIDQEKGWTMLNRGKVIGSIPFNIEAFLCALEELNVKRELSELKKVEQDLAQYKKLQNFAELEREVQRESGVLCSDSVQERFVTKLNILKSEILYCEREKKSLEDVQSDNKSFARMVDNLNLSITVDGKRIRVDSKNVDGLNDTIKMLEYRKKELNSRLVILNKKYQEVMDEKDSYELSLGSDDLLSVYKRKIASIHLNQMYISEAIASLKKRKKMLNERVSAAAANAWSKSIGKNVIKFLERLSVRHNYESFETTVFTSDLYPYSGAEMSKRVLAFHLAYVSAVKNKTGVRLPIIIDSPYSKETDSDNFQRFIDIIRSDFSDHQILIATIRYEQIGSCNLISLNGGLLDGKIVMKYMPPCEYQ